MKMMANKDEFELLGLSPSEKAVIIATSKMAKSITQVSRHTGISRTTVDYIVKKLEKKSFVWSLSNGKRKVWRSNISRILRYLENSQKMKKK